MNMCFRKVVVKNTVKNSKRNSTIVDLYVSWVILRTIIYMEASMEMLDILVTVRGIHV